jgi:hypothetical protein
MNAHIDPNAAHAVYAPSSAHRWTVCTASATAIAAMQRVVTLDEHEAAENGTAAHDEIERILGQFNGQIVEPEALRAAAADLLDFDHPAAYGIALTINYVAGLPAGRVWIEQRVALTDQIWGRCDIAHWHEDSETLTIVDYKNGFVGVDAEENEQLRIYGAASIYTHRLVAAQWIRYAVVQPNDFMPGPRVKQWVESATDLFAWAEKTAAIPRGPLVFKFGPSQCRDCPLLGTCAPTKDVLAQFAAVVATGTDPTPAQIPLFVALKKPIDHFFEGLMKNGTKKALAGSVPPGMKLVTAVKHRQWKSEADARAAVLAAKGVEALKPPTPAQAEDMGIDISGLADKPEGGPALAFESDKRKPWARKGVDEMFKGVADLTGGGK